MREIIAQRNKALEDLENENKKKIREKSVQDKSVLDVGKNNVKSLSSKYDPQVESKNKVD